MRRVIDLNADLGERPEGVEDSQDAELMRYVTSANVACGGHAGNERTMLKTVEAAKQMGVAVGAHPSYPDREGFGRVAMQITLPELARSVREQIGNLCEIAAKVGVRVKHVKPHGALYHSMNHDSALAREICRVVLDIDSTMIVVGQAGSTVLGVAREIGLRTAAEAFADRSYEADGSLRSRKLAGALLDDPELAARQALEIALNRSITVAGGSKISVSAETLCIHSDTPQAVVIAREIRRRLEEAKVEVRSLAEV